MISRKNILYNKINDYVKDTPPSGIVPRLSNVDEFWDEIKLYSSHMPIASKGEMVYVYLNKQTSNMCKCETHKRKFISFKTGYSKYCSKNNNKLCSYHKAHIAQLREVTNLKKYGVKHPTQLPSVQNKKKETNQIKYGVDNVFQSEIIKQKSKETNLKKYGVEIASKSDIIKEKTKLSNQKKYGVIHPNQLTKYKEKIIATTMKTYGVKHIAELSFVKEKRKITMMERYGVEYPTQLIEIKKLIQNKQRNSFFEMLEYRLTTNVTPLFDANQYVGVDHQYNWKCDDCDTEFVDHLDDGSSPICPICSPKLPTTISAGEMEIGQYIKYLNFDIITNDRTLIKPKELDIVIPEKKIAIEYCGLYWHSEEKGKKHDYHQIKTKLANEIGYELLTIFDYEWLSYQDNIKNKIKSLLMTDYDNGNNDKRYASRMIDNEKCNTFIKQHHVKPPVISDINIGAYYNNQLIAVMSFNDDGNETYVITQHCSIYFEYDLNKIIFSYFVDRHKPIMVKSYCDLKWGIDKFYNLCGFTESHTIDAKCWQYLYLSEYGRSHIIQANESHNGKVSGNIWDCGYKVLIWQHKNI